MAVSTTRWQPRSFDGGDASGAPALAAWQRQAVLAAAALLVHRFTKTPDDERARTVHDALLEVMEPSRRAQRLQRELSEPEPIATVSLRAERRARGRRAGTDRRVWEFGPPRGQERRLDERRAADERRARR
jgi:hypothetical protein